MNATATNQYRAGYQQALQDVQAAMAAAAPGEQAQAAAEWIKSNA